MPRRPNRSIPATPTGVALFPDKPSLEFEHKRAKRLLRDLRAGHAEELERARRLRIATRRSASSDFKLADAQLILAREYGFASWPKLAEYFATWARHERAGPVFERFTDLGPDVRVRSIINAHRNKRDPPLLSSRAPGG